MTYHQPTEKPQSKVSQFLGLHGASETAEHQFNFPWIAFGFLMPFIIVIHLIFKWPEQGIPSNLASFDTAVAGGPSWVAADGLGLGVQICAWTFFLGRYLVYAVTSLLMAKVAKDYSKQTVFTQKSLRPLQCAMPFLAVSYFIGQMLYLVIAKGIEKAQGISLATGIFEENTTVPFMLCLALMAFIFAVLKHSVVLQEESDATI